MVGLEEKFENKYNKISNSIGLSSISFESFLENTEQITDRSNSQISQEI